MRDHAIVSPLFWSGHTGQKLRKHPDAQRLALYLMTCPSSNMIGLYYLPIPTICHELGMTESEVRKALRRGIELGFCDYDEPSEVIFVFEMSRFQCARSLSFKDKRKPAVERLLKQFRKCRFYQSFIGKYGEAYNLKKDDAGYPFEGVSEFAPQEQEQEQEQEKDSKSCSEPPAASEPPVMIFPCVGPNSKEWALHASKINQLRESFPGVDIDAECRKARQWCIDNPRKRKTFEGMAKFLSGWMGRVQDSNRPDQKRGSRSPDQAMWETIREGTKE